jgi:hypothetical protein
MDDAISNSMAEKVPTNGAQNHNKEEWLRLCELAAVEQDPEKLAALCRTICQLLEEREKALNQARR